MNEIFKFKERKMEDFKKEQIFEQALKILEQNKNILLYLYFKDSSILYDFINNNIAKIKELNGEKVLDFSINKCQDYFDKNKHNNAFEIVLNDDFCSSIYACVDDKKFYLDNGDVIVIPVIAYWK